MIFQFLDLAKILEINFQGLAFPEAKWKFGFVFLAISSRKISTKKYQTRQ